MFPFKKEIPVPSDPNHGTNHVKFFDEVFHDVLDIPNDDERRQSSPNNDGSNSPYLGNLTNEKTKNERGHSSGSCGSTHEDEIVATFEDNHISSEGNDDV